MDHVPRRPPPDSIPAQHRPGRLALPPTIGRKRVTVYFDNTPILFATVDLNRASLLEVELSD